MRIFAQMRWQYFFFVVLFHVPALLSRPGINLKGAVVNQALMPVKGLTVMLVGGNVRDTTNERGEFVLHRPPTSPGEQRLAGAFPVRDNRGAIQTIALTPSSPSGYAPLAVSNPCDSLRFERSGKRIASAVLAEYNGEIYVILDIVPEEIVSIAASELGDRPNGIGTELDREPYALGHYLGFREAWCSEFVSWAYNVAGFPLTEGSQGGWLHRSSRSLKRWFTRNARFVPRTDPYWESNAPSPGDYIRYDNAMGGHSGIVEAIRGSTLYTIEGNVKNRVVRRKISNWRDREDIDGFGLRSRAHENVTVYSR
ncbi:MAG: CHAP domain-containing protein [Chitinivibrionales bacterium]|nr:CHAP domain-containing protein [Chitinivibrionales bacterium]